MTRRARLFERGLGPVSLAAGFLLLSAFLRADTAPLGRSVAPEPGSDTALVDAPIAPQGTRDFSSDLRDQEERLMDIVGRLRDQQADLSRVAGTIDTTESTLADTAKAQERLAATFEGLRERVESLEKKSLNLDEVQASSAVASAAERTQRQALEAEVASLKLGFSRQRDSLDKQARSLKAAGTDLRRLDSMDELLAMVRRDEETNDEELVELEQSVKRLEPAPASPNALWWQSVLDYRYLPAVATGLAAVALVVAAARH